MKKQHFLYIMANKRNGTLYIGTTSDIVRRTWEHKNKVSASFSARHNVNMLVYYEVHAMYIDAARREKRLKNWPRKWKLNLIEEMNPEWRDLFEKVCF